MASITNNNVVETNESKGPEGNDSRTGYYNDWEKKAKKLADEKGIDLSNISGSGDGGRIIRKDIEEYKGIPFACIW